MLSESIGKDHDMIDMQYYPNPKKMKGHEDFNFAHVYFFTCQTNLLQFNHFSFKKRPSCLTSNFFKIVIQLQNESSF